MMNAVKIFAFTILVVLFYSYVGQMVPQTVTYPPDDTEIGEDMTTEELVEVGAEIVSGQGTCLSCHTMSGETGGRFPDLAGIGAAAGQRVEGMSDVEYLGQSLYEPNEFVVEGFLPGMPPAAQPPISLSDRQILAVIAYLQSLGGEPTVTLGTELPWQSEENSGGGGSEAAPAAPAAAQDMSGQELYDAYACGTCHSLTEPTPMIGPSLYDVGSRLSRDAIYEAILEPDATVAEGFQQGLMAAQLNATGIYDNVSPSQLTT
ncbi:MAG: c-type cytochrome, partial [Rhodothermales bacterium]